MGVVRNVGVWLGLVADEDERDGLFDDEFADEDFAVPVRPTRTLARPTQRGVEHTDRLDRDRYERDRADRDRGDRTGRELRIDRDLRLDQEAPDLPRARALRTDRGAPMRDVRTVVTERSRQTAADSGVDREPRFDREPRLERESRQVASEPIVDDAPPARMEPARAESRSTVRPLARPTPGSTALSYPTQDNLALAPQVQLRERAVISEDRGRRYQITTLHPTSYSEARSIGEQFRDGHPVIMNLTEMDEPDAKRLVDFAAGLAFALRGSMERVTNRVFLLTPPNIRVSDEEKARIAETGFFDPS